MAGLYGDGGMSGLYGPGRDFGRDGGPAVPPEYWEDGHEPDNFDLDDESLFAQDPEKFLHPDDFESAPEAEPWDTPIYHLRTPGADYPDETDPAEWEDREEERAHENLRGHFGKQAPIGGILTQANQWPDRVAVNRLAAEPDCESEGFDHYYRGGQCEDCGKEQPNWDGATDAPDPNAHFHHHGALPRNPELEQRGNGLDMENEEFFHNHDPQLGTTVPEHKYGEPEGAVAIRPPEDAQPGDAVVLHPETTGLEYPVIARWNDDHGSWDVLRPLS